MIRLSLFVSLFAAQLLGQSIHIDAGGSSDRYFSGGWTYTYPGVSTLPTMRYGNFSYSIPLAAGDYTVSLTFVERIVSAAGAHVFSVTANGAAVIPALDIFAEAGEDHALVKSFPVTVGSAGLALRFATITRNAAVNMIDVAAVVGSTPPVLPTGLQFYVSPMITDPVKTFTVPGVAHKLRGMQCRTLSVVIYQPVAFIRADGTPGEQFEPIEAHWSVDASTCDLTVAFAAEQANFYLTVAGMPL